MNISNGYTISNPYLSRVCGEMLSLIDGVKTGTIGHAEGDVMARAGYSIVKAIEVETMARISESGKAR